MAHADDLGAVIIPANLIPHRNTVIQINLIKPAILFVFLRITKRKKINRHGYFRLVDSVCNFLVCAPPQFLARLRKGHFAANGCGICAIQQQDTRGRIIPDIRRINPYYPVKVYRVPFRVFPIWDNSRICFFYVFAVIKIEQVFPVFHNKPAICPHVLQGVNAVIIPD